MDIEREEFLEYDLTSRIFSLSKESKPKIGFIAGLGIDGVLDNQGGAVPPWNLYVYVYCDYLVRAWSKQ